jgi:subtilisin family serine protease
MVVSIGSCGSSRRFQDKFALTLMMYIQQWYSADNGARVINMSLGSEFYSRSEADLVRQATAEGILVIAASGNSGTGAYSYPASHAEAVSVGAVDSSADRASFSQYNDQVDVVAAGDGITTTIPAIVIRDASNPEGDKYQGFLMVGSEPPVETVEADLFDCAEGFDVCTGATGRVCLIERGTTTFSEKSLNCEAGGGIGAIIYNSEDGDVFSGSLGETTVSFPVLGVPRAAGQALISVARVSIDVVTGGYATVGGTSFSTPYVVGVAARLWSVRPECSSFQIREAMEETARDLGDAGRDDLYGNGLVQMVDAYNYLLSLPAPCGSGAPSPPVSPPTSAPNTDTGTPNQDFVCEELTDFDPTAPEGLFACLYEEEPYPILDAPSFLVAVCATDVFVEPTNEICECLVFVRSISEPESCNACFFLESTDDEDGDFEVGYDCSNLVRRLWT